MVASAVSIRFLSPCRVKWTIWFASFLADPARLFSMACFITKARNPTCWSFPETVAAMASCLAMPYLPLNVATHHNAGRGGGEQAYSARLSLALAPTASPRLREAAQSALSGFQRIGEL